MANIATVEKLYNIKWREQLNGEKTVQTVQKKCVVNSKAFTSSCQLINADYYQSAPYS